MIIIKKIKNLINSSQQTRGEWFIFAEIALGITLALASLAVFIAIADEVIEKETQTFDTQIINQVNSWRNPQLTNAMFATSFVGSKEFLFAISIIIIVALFAKNRRRTAFIYAIILLASAGLNNLIKIIIQRDRPDILPIEHASFFSFPSGHSMNSLVFYGLIAYFAWHWTKNKIARSTIIFTATATIALIGFSRVYLGAHYPTDVIAGFIAGIFVLSSAIAIDKTTKLKKAF